MPLELNTTVETCISKHELPKGTKGQIVARRSDRGILQYLLKIKSKRGCFHYNEDEICLMP